jgi:hypothetical protein
MNTLRVGVKGFLLEGYITVVEFSSWTAGYQLPNVTSAYLMNSTLSNPIYVGVFTAVLPRRLGGLVLTLVRLLGELLERRC